MRTPILETDRIILRPPQAEDAPAIFKNWAQNPNVTRYLRWLPHKSIQDTHAFLAIVDKNLKSPTAFDWLLTHKATGEPFGAMGVYHSKAKNMYEIGYCLMEEAWGQGYATEAAKAAVHFASTVLGQSQIYACCAVENPASRQVLEKVGFAYVSDATDTTFDGRDYPVWELVYQKDNAYYSRLCTQFYDIDKPVPSKEELDFYLSYTTPSDTTRAMKILEPMCGSGRFLVPFAKQGLAIDGFDQSNHMIARCKKKLDDQLPQHKGQLVCGDFSFQGGKQYDYIFIAAGSFCLLTSPGAAHYALTQMKTWLAPQGAIVLEVETDQGYQDPTALAAPSPPKTVTDGPIAITMSSQFIGQDHATGVCRWESQYTLHNQGQWQATEKEDFALKPYKTGEFEALAKSTGLTIKGAYVDLAKTPYQGQSSPSIFYHLAH